MKQFALVSLVSAALFVVLALPALSESDTLEVHVTTSATLSVNISQASYDFGDLALSTADTPLSDRTIGQTPSGLLTVQNTGNVAVDLLISGEDAELVGGGSAWQLDCNPADVGTVALNQYVLRFYTPPDSGGTAQAMCPDPTTKTLASDVAIDGSVEFRLIMTMPTGTTIFGDRSSTVTITATES